MILLKVTKISPSFFLVFWLQPNIHFFVNIFKKKCLETWLKKNFNQSQKSSTQYFALVSISCMQALLYCASRELALERATDLCSYQKLRVSFTCIWNVVGVSAYSVAFCAVHRAAFWPLFVWWGWACWALSGWYLMYTKIGVYLLLTGSSWPEQQKWVFCHVQK